MAATFDRIDSSPIRWLNAGIMHAVEGATVFPDIVLLWSKCGTVAVPPNRTLLGFYDVTCPLCREKEAAIRVVGP